MTSKAPGLREYQLFSRPAPHSMSRCLDVSMSRCLDVSMSRCLDVSMRSPRWGEREGGGKEGFRRRVRVVKESGF